MYCRVFACDFDGTGASDGHLAPELAAALGKARARGLTTVLVTGRVHEEVEALCADLSIFDAIVAENGAIVCLLQGRRVIQLGPPPSAEMLAALRAAGVPFHAGAVVLGTWESHAHQLFDLVRREGVNGQITFNRAAVMLLPSGIDKATGLARALRELGRSEHNLIAFGDAENDLPLFAAAEVAVAARDAVPVVARQADDTLSQPDGAGVARYIHRVLDGGCRLPTPPHRRIPLGCDPAGDPVSIPATGHHVLVSGDPRSGKSWLIGLCAEQLLEQEYRFCLIDPEGDHTALGHRRGMLTLGRDVPVPDSAVLRRLIVDQGLSLVLVLTALAQHAQRSYVEAALRVLQDSGDATGLPHWVLVDEAQYFFDEAAAPVRFDGGVTYLLGTYRPSLLSAAVHDAIGAHIITRTVVEEERYAMTSMLQARGPHGIAPFEALSALEPPRAGLLLETVNGPRWTIFDPAVRTTVHAHHARKYADTTVPVERAFWFGSLPGTPGPVARNVAEFHRAVATVPESVLRDHLVAGDFSRWTDDVLGDRALARSLHKLERTVQHGATANRAEVLAHIEDRYDLRAARGPGTVCGPNTDA